LWAQLRFAPTRDEIHWFEGRFSERGPEGLVRIRYRMLGRGKLAVADRVDDIEWFYRIGFGSPECSTKDASD